MKNLILGTIALFVTAAGAGAQQIGTTYCTSSSNSTGQAGELAAYGVPQQSGVNVALIATNCPPGSVGIFFYGQNQTSMPFMDGTLCISPAGGGFSRIQPPLVIDGTGAAVHYLTNEQTVPGSGGNPGQLTMNYQFWFRDVAAGGSGSNLTSAVEIEFEPCTNCQ